MRTGVRHSFIALLPLVIASLYFSDEASAATIVGAIYCWAMLEELLSKKMAPLPVILGNLGFTIVAASTVYSIDMMAVVVISIMSVLFVLLNTLSYIENRKTESLV